MRATLLTRPRSLGAFVVVYWLDVFTRNEYKNIVPDTLRYCQQEKMAC